MSVNRQNRTQSGCEFRWVTGHHRWQPHYACRRTLDRGLVRIFPPESALFGGDGPFKGVWVVMVFGPLDLGVERVEEYKGEVAERMAFQVAARNVGVPSLHTLR